MLELMILSNLMLKPCHGYELKTKLQVLNPNNNKIYPLLKKLAAADCVTLDMQQQDNNPPRKVYSITEKGKDRLIELLSNYNTKNAFSDDEFYIRVAFFQLLDNDTIKNILETRKHALSSFGITLGIIENLQNFPDMTYDILLLQNYLSAKTQTELRFIESLKQKYGITD